MKHMSRLDITELKPDPQGTSRVPFEGSCFDSRSKLFVDCFS